MRALTHLTLITLVSAAGALALGATAWSAGTSLTTVPLLWWTAAQLTQIVVALVCGLGAAGCLWHLVSAGLALVIVSEEALGAAGGHRSKAHGALAGRASTVLHRWGAPLVRRITIGAAVAGLAIAPAATASESRTPDDLGWQVTADAAPIEAEADGEPAPPEATTPPSGADAAAYSSPVPTPPLLPPSASPSFDPGPLLSPRPAGPPADASADSSAESASPSPAPPRESTHVVEPGESLWSITAESLGPDSSAESVARFWPRVYEANADRIGADPSLIRPGAALQLPDDLPQP